MQKSQQRIPSRDSKVVSKLGRARLELITTRANTLLMGFTFWLEFLHS